MQDKECWVVYACTEHADRRMVLARFQSYPDAYKFLAECLNFFDGHKVTYHAQLYVQKLLF